MLETTAAGATTSKGWTQEQQLLRAGHNIWRSSNYWQHEAGDDGSRSNNFLGLEKGATTSKSWTQHKGSSNFRQLEVGEDSSRSNNF